MADRGSRLSRRALALVALVVVAPLGAQEPRYEIGLRLRAFERRFEAVLGDVAVRARVCPTLERAVAGFFGLRLPDVARAIDEAGRLLEGAAGTDVQRWADAVTFVPAARLVDAGVDGLEYRLVPFYRTDLDAPAGTSVRLRWRDAEGRGIGEPQNAPLTGLPYRGSVALPESARGDLSLVIEIRVGDAVIVTRRQTVSVVADVQSRVEPFLPLVTGRPKDARGTTMRGLARLLRTLLKGRTTETDVPAAALLAELERLVTEDGEGARTFGMHRPGDHRVWLATPGGSCPTRLLVPRVQDRERSRPLVVALHGAGGTENMFFDGYGAGKIVHLCAQRGWLLVAPRTSSYGGDPRALVEALAKHYPVDRRRVVLVGHSMGAAQAMAAATATPKAYAAVAALGGGGSVRPGPELAKLPVFLAPGARDFALGNARRLRDALQRARVERLEYREYDATEHLGIVQVALGDAFAFFDAVLREGR